MKTPNSEAGAQTPWLDEAWRLFGVHERRGRADHPDIMSLYRDVGHPGIAHDETPWCAAFLGACLERAGERSTRSLMARSYSQWGVRLSKPRTGAVVVLSRGPDPVYGHVGFWLGETASKLFLLGGNQSDSISVTSFDKRRLIDVRWPRMAQDHSAGSQKRRGPRPNFQRCLAHVLEMEGGYSNDPYDPGGPTNFGITLKVYAKWHGLRLGASNHATLKARLKNIQASEVAAIYRKNYWRQASCEDFSPGLALMHFDCAVNQGVSRAIRFLQQAVGTDVDGEIGPLTRAAAAGMSEQRAVDAYADIRRNHYRSLHHFWRFGRGWLRRATRTLALAKKMAHEVAAQASKETDREPAHQTTEQAPIATPSARLTPSTPEPASQPNPSSRPDQCTCPPMERSSEMAAPHSETLNPEPFKKETSMPTKSIMPGKAKWWGHSMTIWGVIVTTLSTVLPTLGPVIGIDVTPDLVENAGQQLVTTVQAISGLIGTLMTIYGRARATTPLVQRSVNLHI